MIQFFSGFGGNSHAQKLNNVQTNQADMMVVQYFSMYQQVGSTLSYYLSPFRFTYSLFKPTSFFASATTRVHPPPVWAVIWNNTTNLPPAAYKADPTMVPPLLPTSPLTTALPETHLFSIPMPPTKTFISNLAIHHQPMPLIGISDEISCSSLRPARLCHTSCFSVRHPPIIP